MKQVNKNNAIKRNISKISTTVVGYTKSKKNPIECQNSNEKIKILCILTKKKETCGKKIHIYQ